MPLRFDWDEANVAKIWLKHRVGPDEAESVFDDPFRFVAVTREAQGEMRYICVGSSSKDKLRTAVYTKRVQKSESFPAVMPTKKKSAVTSKGKTSRVKPEDEKDLSRYMTEENRLAAEALLAKLDKPARKKKAA